MRNPLDVIVSVAHMTQTMSHELVPKEQYHIDFPEFWDAWINKQITNMSTYHGYLINTIAKEIPTYCMRYEDLVSNPVDILTELMEFLLEVPSLKGTVCEARIKKVCEVGNQSHGFYKLKTTSNKFNRNSHVYNKEQILRITESLRDLNQFFGYADHPSKTNDT